MIQIIIFAFFRSNLRCKNIDKNKLKTLLNDDLIDHFLYIKSGYLGFRTKPIGDLRVVA